MIGALICFSMAAINMPFIIDDPSGNWLNTASAGFSFGMGIACLMMDSRN